MAHYLLNLLAFIIMMAIGFDCVWRGDKAAKVGNLASVLWNGSFAFLSFCMAWTVYPSL